MKKSSSHNKAKYMTKGAYGCVFSPPLSCSATNSSQSISSSDSGVIGKIFSNRDDYQAELDAYVLVNEIDPGFKWSLPLIKTCKPSLPPGSQSGELSKCPFIKPNGRSKLMQIVMPYGGNTLLHHYETTSVTILDFMRHLQSVLRAIVDLQRVGYAHLDIKPSNILITSDPLPHVYVIDYSLMARLKDVYEDDNMYLFKSEYLWYPPEFFIYYILKKFGVVESWDVKNSLYIFGSDVERYGIPMKRYRRFFDQQMIDMTFFARYLSDSVKSGASRTNALSKLSGGVDVYSAGATFYNLFYKQRYTRRKDVELLLQRMMCADPRLRISAEEAYNEIGTLIMYSSTKSRSRRAK